MKSIVIAVVLGLCSLVAGENLGRWRITHMQKTSNRYYRYNPVATTRDLIYSSDRECSISRIAKEDCCGCCARQMFEIIASDDSTDAELRTYTIRMSGTDNSELYKTLLNNQCPPKEREYSFKLLRSWGNSGPSKIQDTWIQVKDKETGLCLAADTTPVKANIVFEACVARPAQFSRQAWYFNNCK